MSATTTRRSTRRPAEVQAKIWVERGGKVVLSDWRADLLQAIDETGSLSQAAARMEVPYRTAWYKLKEIEEQLGVTLVETHSGGQDGGGSTLTAEGREILRRFRRVYRDVEEMVRRRFEREFEGRL
jgi:molybdate transport system regulatory protein